MASPLDGNDPMREIVGVMFGTVVHRDLRTIVGLAKGGREPDRLVSRAEMQFMDACDLGPRWKDWANSPTLFLIGKNGKPQWPLP